MSNCRPYIAIPYFHCAILLLILYLPTEAVGQRPETCDSVQHKYYSIHFFLQSDIRLNKYEWDNPVVNCQLNKAQKYHNHYTGFITGTGVSLAIGTGLMASGLAWAIPHKELDYKMGYTLAFTGIGACAIAVPLFVLADINNRKARRALQNIKSF